MRKATLADQPRDTFQEYPHLAVNIGGAMVAAQAAAPKMMARGSGSILFTGGGFALQPHPDYLSLSIGKAGIRALAQGILSRSGKKASTSRPSPSQASSRTAKTPTPSPNSSGNCRPPPGSWQVETLCSPPVENRETEHKLDPLANAFSPADRKLAALRAVQANLSARSCSGHPRSRGRDRDASR